MRARHKTTFTHTRSIVVVVMLDYWLALVWWRRRRRRQRRVNVASRLPTIFRYIAVERTHSTIHINGDFDVKQFRFSSHAMCAFFCVCGPKRGEKSIVASACQRLVEDGA